jgi:hypothetical protein
VDDCRLLVSHQDPIELLRCCKDYLFLTVALLPLTVLFWLFLFGYI